MNILHVFLMLTIDFAGIVNIEDRMRLENQQVVELIIKNRTHLISYGRSIACEFHAAEDIFQKMCLKTIQGPDAFEDTNHLPERAGKAVVIRC